MVELNSSWKISYYNTFHFADLTGPTKFIDNSNITQLILAELRLTPYFKISALFNVSVSVVFEEAGRKVFETWDGEVWELCVEECQVWNECFMLTNIIHIPDLSRLPKWKHTFSLWGFKLVNNVS